MVGLAYSVTLLIGVDTGAVVWISVNAPLYYSSKRGVQITQVGSLKVLRVYLNSPKAVTYVGVYDRQQARMLQGHVFCVTAGRWNCGK